MVVLAEVIPNPAGAVAVASLAEVVVAAFGSKAVVGVGGGGPWEGGPDPGGGGPQP
jgi:hypothetical protein